MKIKFYGQSLCEIQKDCLFTSIKRRGTFARVIGDARHERQCIFGVLFTNDQQIVAAELMINTLSSAVFLGWSHEPKIYKDTNPNS
jgi:hypothetical protein